MSETAGRGHPLLRPALHAATGLCALALGVLPREGAILCAVGGIAAGWIAIPLFLEDVLRRPGEPWLGGLRTYPIAVLGLVLFLPPAEAAAAWAILAFGDAAATVVGTRVKAPRIFGHPKATVSGSLAYLLVGSLAAWGMSNAVHALGSSFAWVDPGAAPGAARCMLAASSATLVDMVRIPPDDNLPAAGVAGAVLALTRGLGGG